MDIETFSFDVDVCLEAHIEKEEFLMLSLVNLCIRQPIVDLQDL